MIADEQFLGCAGEVENLGSLDAALGKSGLFTVYREVTGYYVHALPGEQVKDCRIDRILAPTAETIRRGWTLGPIGIEAKGGGLSIGKPICQAMDYRRAAFSMPQGFDVILRWVFLYPMGKQKGAIESVMNQHGLGCCFWGSKGTLMFSADGRIPLRIGETSDIGSMPLSGAKRGSR